MIDSSTLRQAIEQAIRDLGRGYSVVEVRECRDRAGCWYASMCDPDAPKGARFFKVLVDEDIVSTREDILNEVMSQLRRRSEKSTLPVSPLPRDVGATPMESHS